MPNAYVHTVTVDFTSHEDATALRDLIRELGYEAQLTYRSVNEGTRTAMRNTRLGIIVLELMTPPAGQKAKTFTAEDLAPVLEAHHFAARSGPVVLSVLTAEGDIERLLRGVYRVKQ